MAAGRMPHHDDTLEIKLMLRSKGAEQVNRRPYIQIGSRPAPTRLAQAPIFNIPNCKASAFKGIGHRSKSTQRGEARLPTASVNEDHHRMGPVTVRDPQLGFLIWAVTIS